MEQDDRDDYVYSSSSADSIAGGSNDEDIYAEEVIEDEGENEIVLVPGKEVKESSLFIWRIIPYFARQFILSLIHI